MEDILVGDRISLTFDDMPGNQQTAIVVRVLSDRDEGLAPEIEDYVAGWFEIAGDADRRGAVECVALLTDGRYSLGGRFVTVQKLSR